MPQKYPLAGSIAQTLVTELSAVNAWNTAGPSHSLRIVLLNGNEIIMDGFQDGSPPNIYTDHLQGADSDGQMFIVALAGVATVSLIGPKEDAI